MSAEDPGESHHDATESFKRDPYVRSLIEDTALRALGTTTLERDESMQGVHFAIGRMVITSFLDEPSGVLRGAVKFLPGAMGPPETAHGGAVTVAFDHFFGHCLRAVVGVGPQFTVNLHVEFKAPALIGQTFSCQCQVSSRESRHGSGRMRVTLQAVLRTTAASPTEVAIGRATFVCIVDKKTGELTMHQKPFSPKLLEAQAAARARAAATPVRFAANGHITAPFFHPYFICRGGIGERYPVSKAWMQSDALVAELSREPGLVRIGEELAGAWLWTKKGCEHLGPLRVLNGRVLECYYADLQAPRVVAAVRFTALTEGPKGKAHGGAIAAFLDESFTWLQVSITERLRSGRPGGTAWLDVNLRKPVPLGQTCRVVVSLERSETKDNEYFKLYCKSQLMDAEGRETLAEATTLTLSPCKLVLPSRAKAEAPPKAAGGSKL